MQIYIMDSDYEVMKKLESLINGNYKSSVKCFTGPLLLLKAVKNESPDLIMIDFDMQNSFSAVKSIKSESPNTKIIMMSDNQNKAIELFELGLNGFLLKPIDEEKVKELIYRFQHPLLSKLTSK